MELLQVVDSVSREKKIDREEIIGAMEEAIRKAGRSKYGYEYDIRAHIDRKSGDVSLFRFREVVEEIENPATQMLLNEAKAIQPNVEVGEFIK